MVLLIDKGGVVFVRLVSLIPHLFLLANLFKFFSKKNMYPPLVCNQILTLPDQKHQTSAFHNSLLHIHVV